MASPAVSKKDDMLPPLYEQFEQMDQQLDSYIIGMWAFLVTEVMFFGALFTTYMLYRWRYQPQWYEVHKELDLTKGAINTVILLTSSFTMACAVHFAQLKKYRQQLMCLAATLACAFGFLFVKYLEYSTKIHHHHFPGLPFEWHNPAVPAPIAQLFFSLYFTMTGLHGIHVVVGILVIGILAICVARGVKAVTQDYIVTELIGLYWHFVDLVWIFLFPLYYLMPK